MPKTTIKTFTIMARLTVDAPDDATVADLLDDLVFYVLEKKGTPVKMKDCVITHATLKNESGSN